MELVKVKFKGGWALAEPADVGKGMYELYIEPVEAEKEEETAPPVVFPTCVGMNRAAKAIKKSGAGVPHVCGDEPL